MKRYEFYRNQKITVIDCRYFSFEAENLETAVQKIKELCADGQLDELSNDPTYQEDVAYQIPGTEYPLDIENNNGDPTVMIYSAADGNCIMDNLPKRSIKCLSMPARRGGTDNSQRSKSESGKSLPNEYPEQTRSALRVVLPFTKITEGDDAGKWKATVRLLGVTGTEQLLMGEIRYADGNPTPTTLKSDLTEALKEFNTGKGESLTLGGTLVETPEGMEVDGAGINGWEEVKGDDVNADL